MTRPLFNTRFHALLVLAWATACLPVAAAVQVVTTLPSYASIALAVGGDRVSVQSISRPNEDAHFVKPKPSLALMLKKADLFVTTGLDLEIWAPVLVDKSGNRRIRDGADGFVAAAAGVPMLDVPTSASRAAGDIHLYGNPHIHTSPINAKIIAGNIAAGLVRVDPAGADIYQENLEAFRQQIDVALYGVDLVTILGAAALDPLAQSDKLIAFLATQTFHGQPLLNRLGGWLGRGLAFRDRQIIAYHKNWTYLTSLFGLQVVDYVEAKPGIPPSARHVHALVDEIADQQIRVLLTADYFATAKPQAIADRTGCQVVRVGLEPDGDPPDYFALVDGWVDALATAFVAGGEQP